MSCFNDGKRLVLESLSQGMPGDSDEFLEEHGWCTAYSAVDSIIISMTKTMMVMMMMLNDDA